MDVPSRSRLPCIRDTRIPPISRQRGVPGQETVAATEMLHLLLLLRQCLLLLLLLLLLLVQHEKQQQQGQRCMYVGLCLCPCCCCLCLLFQASTVSAGVGCRIGPLAAIEGDSSIAANTEIRESLVGQRCIIGGDCKIVGSLLLADVVIENGVTVKDSLIASKCIIKQGAVINRGCLLAPGVVVGRGVSLPPLTRCCLPEAPALQQRGEQEETAGAAALETGTAAAADVSLGPDGKGVVFPYLGSSPADFEALNLGASVLPRIRLPLPKFEAEDDDVRHYSCCCCCCYCCCCCCCCCCCYLGLAGGEGSEGIETTAAAGSASLKVCPCC